MAHETTGRAAVGRRLGVAPEASGVSASPEVRPHVCYTSQPRLRKGPGPPGSSTEEAGLPDEGTGGRPRPS